MVDSVIQEIVDVLANPYLFGLPVEESVPVSVRKRGELFSQSMLTLRKMKYPPTHNDKKGNRYVSARAFAALGSNGGPTFGVVVWAGRGYDVYVYEETAMRLVLEKKDVKLDSKDSLSAKKNFLAALRGIPRLKNTDIFSVRVYISNNEYSPRQDQILSDGDIEADAYA